MAEPYTKMLSLIAYFALCHVYTSSQHVEIFLYPSMCCSNQQQTTFYHIIPPDGKNFWFAFFEI